MQNYKELKVWQKSHNLTIDIYHATKSFPKEELYGLTSQLRRSASSVGLNLVEGCGRFTNPDIVNFFQNSFSSAQETEYCLILCKDLKYIDIVLFNDFEERIEEIKKMLVGLIKKLRTVNSKL
ncbi:MAG: four helix bundle protein [Bacteroidota bacterium]|nr:four helix bundle protein [Bacteroidota bacterium]